MGHGQGKAKDYVPWFKVRDVPSQGECREIQGLITNRVHHLLSKLEYYVFVLAERWPGVIDIREQYALLPLIETLSISADLGIRHPVIPGTRTPVVMTTDLVLSVRLRDETALIPISVKPFSKILDSSEKGADRKVRRTLEKLIIEKTYWARRGINCQIITEKSIPVLEAFNIGIFRKSLISPKIQNLAESLIIFKDEFMGIWMKDLKLEYLLSRISEKIAKPKNEVRELFAAASWLSLIDIDLNRPIQDNHEIALKNGKANSQYLRPDLGALVYKCDDRLFENTMHAQTGS